MMNIPLTMKYKKRPNNSNISGGSFDNINVNQSQRPDEKSQFHILYNTNIGYNQYLKMNNEQKIKLLAGIKEATDELRSNYRIYLRTKSPKDANKIKLIDSTINLEVGRDKGMLHVDGYLAFDKRCLLNTKKISELFNNAISEINIYGGFFNVTFIPDLITRVKKYSEKDGVTL